MTYQPHDHVALLTELIVRMGFRGPVTFEERWNLHGTVYDYPSTMNK